MTKEELEKEAEKYWIDQPPFTEIRDRVVQAYIDSAEPREEQIQIDAEQIRALQKQNGELTDRVQELEAQIEKMKCCSNCKYFYCPTASKVEKDGKVLFHNWNKEKQSFCNCGNGKGKKYQLWEIKENE